jgi:hypothetical protein
MRSHFEGDEDPDHPAPRPFGLSGFPPGSPEFAGQNSIPIDTIAAAVAVPTALYGMIALYIFGGIALYRVLFLDAGNGTPIYADLGIAVVAIGFGWVTHRVRDVRSWPIVAIAQILLGGAGAAWGFLGARSLLSPLPWLGFFAALFAIANGFEKLRKLKQGLAK